VTMTVLTEERVADLREDCDTADRIGASTVRLSPDELRATLSELVALRARVEAMTGALRIADKVLSGRWEKGDPGKWPTDQDKWERARDAVAAALAEVKP